MNQKSDHGARAIWKKILYTARQKRCEKIRCIFISHNKSPTSVSEEELKKKAEKCNDADTEDKFREKKIFGNVTNKIILFVPVSTRTQLVLYS